MPGGGSASETLSGVIGRAICASRGPSLLPCLLIPAPRTAHLIRFTTCSSPGCLDGIRQSGGRGG